MINRVLLTLGLSMIIGQAFAADPPSKLVAGLCGGQTFAVVRIDLAQLKFDEFRKRLGDWPELTAMEKPIAELRAADVATVFIIVNSAEWPKTISVMALPAKSGEAAVAASALGKLGMPGLKVKPWGSGAVAASVDGWKRIESNESAALPGDFDQVFTTNGDAPVAALAWMPKDMKRVLAELAPTLPAQFGSESTAHFIHDFQIATVRLHVGERIKASGDISFSNAEAARRAVTIIESAKAAFAGRKHSNEGWAASAKVLSAIKVSAENTQVKVSFDETTSGNALTTMISAARDRARISQDMNKLRRMAIGFHSYYDGAKPQGLPTDICDRNGKPMLSWRVAILPNIGAGELFGKFKLDEPWDSPNNKPLLAQMPAAYRAANQNADASRTTFLAPLGPSFVMVPGAAKGIRFQDIQDGTSNTIMIVQVPVDLAVDWTKPADWTPDATDPRKGVFVNNRSVMAAFCDGSVRLLPNSLDAATLKGLLTRSGGELNTLP